MMGGLDLGTAKPRILLVDLGAGYGGSMVYMESLQHLIGDRFAFSGLCLNPESVRALRSLGVPTLSLALTRMLGKPVQVLASLAVLPYLRFRCRVDAVWVQGITDVMLLPLARLMGCKTIVTRHLTTDTKGRRWHEAAKRYAAELIHRHLIRAADRIFCVSKTVARDLDRSVSPNRTTVIPNWVSLPSCSLECDRPRTGPLRLLFVGRLMRHKGVSLILNAMRKLCGGSVSLTIVGDGECKRELQRLSHGLPVEFAGFRRDTCIFYREADLFINPSLGPEGLPLVSLEAMSYGLPCVFSDLPVHEEITDKGKYALLFRRGDSDDLSAKIEMLLSEPQILAEYGQLGRSVVEARYSMNAARGRYIEKLPI
jgi:glycosyltransferase involved in cell wall biosynthesis